MTELEKATRNYLLNEHISPLNDILHKCDLKMEMQYHTDIENAFKAGANCQREQFEKERLKHCDELTAEQAQIESDFVVQHLKNFNRTPTFIDAIEHGRKTAFDKAIEWIKLYILNHDDIDIFEMETAFKNELMEE